MVVVNGESVESIDGGGDNIRILMYCYFSVHVTWKLPTNHTQRMCKHPDVFRYQLCAFYGFGSHQFRFCSSNHPH